MTDLTGAGVRRDVRAGMTFRVTDPTAFVLAIQPAAGVPTTIESLRVRHDGEEIATRIDRDDVGTRLAVFEAGEGVVSIDYVGTVHGRAAPTGATDIDLVRALRPSRYAQSDVLTPLARDTFSGIEGAALVRAVGDWVHGRLVYDGARTDPLGGAVETLDSGAGVCRDFANVTAALLRALDVPARTVSVYAPQLDPMDFHAVVEAWIEGRWVVVDSTRLAPRRGLVRIATGRDAADTAWATNTLADVELLSISVDARADEEWTDDPDELVELS